MHAQVNIAILKLLFVEELDLVVAASEDNNICKFTRISFVDNYDIVIVTLIIVSLI